jgi:hypothetical protein
MFKEWQKKIAHKGIKLDTKTKGNTRKPEEKVDGRNKEGHERKKTK